ncbi:MAG TPA: hypothetical protein VLF18_09215 [Tahibacter sp.]|uniref:hypothetical protein n=1 Tax=Tahibacter sp. TaxID=2056211 RepID=UPI002C6A7C6F|nr:hypothetical protein [Tahibacter sp.]HSX60365.1 hypothetical protein [Tahibacter sp.]
MAEPAASGGQDDSELPRQPDTRKAPSGVLTAERRTCPACRLIHRLHSMNPQQCWTRPCLRVARSSICPPATVKYGSACPSTILLADLLRATLTESPTPLRFDEPSDDTVVSAVLLEYARPGDGRFGGDAGVRSAPNNVENRPTVTPAAARGTVRILDREPISSRDAPAFHGGFFSALCGRGGVGRNSAQTCFALFWPDSARVSRAFVARERR